METSSPHTDTKEPSDYQKLKGLAIKLKKELDFSKNKITALERDLKDAKHFDASDKLLNKISLADILSSCPHKVGIDQENINGISNPEEYCISCIDAAQGYLNTYIASAKDNSKLKADFEALTLANRHLQEENERLNGQVVRLHQEMGTIEDNKELLRVKDLEIEGFEKSLSNLKSELRTKDERIYDLEKESQKMENKMAELDICIAQLNGEKETLIAQETEQKKLINGLEAELSNNKDMVTTLSEEKNNLSNRLKDVEATLQETLNDSERENELLNEKIDTFSAVNRELEAKLDATKDRLAVETANSQKLALELNKCCLEHEKYKVRVHQILDKQTTKCDISIQTVESSQEFEEVKKCRSCDNLENALEKVDSNNAKLRERLRTLEREKEDFMSEETLVKRNISNNLDSFDTRTSRLLKDVENRQMDCRVKLDIFHKKLLLFVATLEKRTANLTPPPSSPIAAQSTTPAHGLKPSQNSPTSTDTFSQNKPRDFKEGTSKYRGGRRKRSLDRLIDDWLQKSSNLDLPDPRCGPSEPSPNGQAGPAEMRIAHLQELLGETEGQVRRLSEQVEVLKREIRRLDQAQPCKDVNKGVEFMGNGPSLDGDVVYRHNLEYLKNVFYKFLCPEIDVKQRKSLVPVINTLLTLTPSQQQTLKVMADTTLLKPNQSENCESLQGTYNGYTLGSILPSSLTSYLQR